MATERAGASPVDSFTETVKRKSKEVVLFVAEKSIFLTIPLTAYLFYTGAISGTVALLATGGDIVTSKVAGNMRRNK